MIILPRDKLVSATVSFGVGEFARARNQAVHLLREQLAQRIINVVADTGIESDGEREGAGYIRAEAFVLTEAELQALTEQAYQDGLKGKE